MNGFTLEIAIKSIIDHFIRVSEHKIRLLQRKIRVLIIWGKFSMVEQGLTSSVDGVVSMTRIKKHQLQV
ncbi:hypothetical protein BCT58_17635 [Vibrio lentus]|nr:hypothetical protein BCT58_17635 [Vibrio lentus]